jgi:hypothetical protein
MAPAAACVRFFYDWCAAAASLEAGLHDHRFHRNVMRSRIGRRAANLAMAVAILVRATPASGQITLTWDDAKPGLRAASPALRAGQTGVQESRALETAAVNLRTAKIQFQAPLNDRAPADQLEVSGPFAFTEVLTPLQEFRLAVANGSKDPTVGVHIGRDPPIPAFCRCQYQHSTANLQRQPRRKMRTQLDIGRNERLLDAARLQLFSDVVAQEMVI